jgi:putative Mg2+ transporter-C (MgtC) family protein
VFINGVDYMGGIGFLSIATMQFYLILTARLILACVLGGIVGYERESMNRPAGFRTHILVCVGASLVMITSEFIFREYKGMANMDPARLGAQVISGIGFLGAGTIIREGFSVRGLTTAASLWAVSCVGIAAGIGFYEGAIAATVIIYLTLILLRKFENQFSKKSQYKLIYVQTNNLPGQVGAITHVFGRYDVLMKNIEFVDSGDVKNTLIKFLIKLPHNLSKEIIINDIQQIEGIQKVYED